MQWFEGGKPTSRYEGDYRHGKAHGYVEYRAPDRTSYKGEYREGLWNGYGILTAPDGDRYEGEHLDHQRHGHGVFTAAKGAVVYVGEWRVGKADGPGVLTLRQERYSGNWSKGCLRWKASTVYLLVAHDLTEYGAGGLPPDTPCPNDG
jgi:hypothetical protein